MRRGRQADYLYFLGWEIYHQIEGVILENEVGMIVLTVITGIFATIGQSF